MARVKRGVTKHARHKKVLKLAKGYVGRTLVPASYELMSRGDSVTQVSMALGGGNVRVNAIAPGLVETKFASAIVANPMLNGETIRLDGAIRMSPK